LTTATVADRVVVATLTDAKACLARKLEECSKVVKEVKSLLKKERAERRGYITYPSHLLWIIIVGWMVTRLQGATPSKIEISPRMGTIVMQQKQTTWEGAMQTRNDVRGRNL
jgi:hypothetical protein